MIWTRVALASNPSPVIGYGRKSACLIVDYAIGQGQDQSGQTGGTLSQDKKVKNEREVGLGRWLVM